MIRHISSIAEFVEDLDAAIHFYRDALGLEVKHEAGSNYALVEVGGTLHFGLWARQGAAEATYGDAGKAADIPLGFSIGFEVDEVTQATQACQAQGVEFLQAPQAESWGQTTSRFLSPSGALCELAETPSAHRITRPMEVEQSEEN